MSAPAPISLDEAWALLLAEAAPLEGESVPVAEALGRYAASDVIARRTQPAADLSAMDGYAVGVDDLSGPWRVVGESAAGRPFAGALSAGEAIRISTGAQMPGGGGAVLLQENAERDGDKLRLANADGPTARHIRRKGFDFNEGDTLIEAGQRIGPAQIALAIMGGNAVLSATRRPSLAIIDSGSELAANPANVATHQLPASNGPMVLAMSAPFVASAQRIGPVPDDLDALVRALESAGDADVIVTSGGASVGDHDLVRPALERWGATIGFWRVAIKPGKPLLVARRGKRIALGLPGNPVSAYVTAYLFLLPLLRHLSGATSPLPRATPISVAEAMPAVGSRTEFVRARLGEGSAMPLDEQDSSALRALAKADVLIRRDAGAASARAGSLHDGYFLRNGGIA